MFTVSYFCRVSFFRSIQFSIGVLLAFYWRSIGFLFKSIRFYSVLFVLLSTSDDPPLAPYLLKVVKQFCNVKKAGNKSRLKVFREEKSKLFKPVFRKNVERQSGTTTSEKTLGSLGREKLKRNVFSVKNCKRCQN